MNEKQENASNELLCKIEELNREKMMNSIFAEQLKSKSTLNTRNSELDDFSEESDSIQLNDSVSITNDYTVLEEVIYENDVSFQVPENVESNDQENVEHPEQQTSHIRDVCENVFMDGPNTCHKRNCKKKHKLDHTKIWRGVCFKEFHAAGSCNRLQLEL